jgi:hypothetical protein
MSVHKSQWTSLQSALAHSIYRQAHKLKAMNTETEIAKYIVCVELPDITAITWHNRNTCRDLVGQMWRRDSLEALHVRGGW